MPRGPSDVLTTSATAIAIKAGKMTDKRSQDDSVLPHCRGGILTLSSDDVSGADVLRLLRFD